MLKVVLERPDDCPLAAPVVEEIDRRIQHWLEGVTERDRVLILPNGWRFQLLEMEEAGAGGEIAAQHPVAHTG